MPYGIGIDIGSTCAKTIVMDENGGILRRMLQPTGWSSVDGLWFRFFNGVISADTSERTTPKRTVTGKSTRTSTGLRPAPCL